MLEKSRKQANRCLHAAAECPAQLGPNTPECENEGRGECISFFFSHSGWKDQLDGVVNSELLITEDVEIALLDRDQCNIEQSTSFMITKFGDLEEITAPVTPAGYFW